MNIKDRSLFEKASKGKTKAIHEIWNKWSPKITMFLHNIYDLNQEDREDLHQEIMAKVYNSLKSYKKTYSPATWIYTISKRTVIDWKRKNYSNYKIVREDQLGFDKENFFENYPSEYLSPEKIILKNEEIKLVQKFIASQSEKKRQILFLVCYEGLSIRAASKILEIPIETVRDNFKKIKRNLQEEMNEII